MSTATTPLTAQTITQSVADAIKKQPIRDLHTHLYAPPFGTPVANATGKTDAAGLLLWGVDELVTYHYLVAEVYRIVPATVLPYEQFWKMSKTAQADHIWKHLFVEHTPISEACRGVLTSLKLMGLDPNEKTLEPYRKFFAQQDPGKYIDKVMEIANISSITMTNAVFDDNERNRWLANPKIGSDPRFAAVLRFDPLLIDYPSAAKKMNAWGYDVSLEIGQKTIAEAQRFLRDWIDRQKAIYLAVSLPPTFRYPADPADPIAMAGQAMIERVVLPVCAERGLPFAMMIGSRRGINPSLNDAGDMVGRADIDAVLQLCAKFPQNKFLVTMLSRDNQHELCVAARKFGNLLPFGCWWFLNNPSLIEEMTRMRLELLGTSFVPQHSDARILDQLLYKWNHTAQILTKVLADKYTDVINTGYKLTAEHVARDVKGYLEGNFTSFLSR